MPKISVIIPVYNTEKYLQRCLDSVLNQTLSDIEVICINDCSPDNCLSVLKEYAQRDGRIKLIDFEENKGAAVARNRGIDEAQGEYIGFVDSDDFVDLDFYEKLYKTAIETGADIVKGYYKYTNTNIINKALNNKIAENKENFIAEFCSAIYISNVVKNNNIKFPELIEMEDPIFTFQTAHFANKVEIVEGANINIVVRKESTTYGIPTDRRIRDRFKGIEIIIELAEKYNTNEKSLSYIFVFWLVLYAKNSLLNRNPTTRLYVVEKVLMLFSKLDKKNIVCLKDEFLILDPYLYNCLKNNDYCSIFYLIEDQKIKSLMEKYVIPSLRNKITKAYK